MSVKFQVTLREDMAEELKSAAARLGVPLAQLIRETMAAKLRDVKAAKPRDPFAWMDGLADLDETDLASRVDEILYRDASVH
ncbi:MAG: ribbon-helix-helix domain-containing protein [Acidobacteria bacterium]|nr:ribbon-helix-helix domain-containing protein [Acidobacteriota bacterium]